MKQWLKTLAILVLVFGGIERAGAGPIDFSFTGIGDGSIGRLSFFDAFFDLQIVADTANVETTTFGIPAYTGLSGSIEFIGMGVSGTFTSPLYVFNNQSNQVVGFGIVTDQLDLHITEAGLDTYGLQTTFGPTFPTTPAAFVTSLGETDNGTLIFSSMNQVEFSAVTFSASPEPGSFTLFSLTILGMVGYGWRRRKTRPC